MNTRFCSQCGQGKPLDEFGVNKTKPLGRAYCCKKCRRRYDREHPRSERSKDPKKKAQVAKWHQSEHGKMMSRLARARRFAINKEKYRAKEMIEGLVNKGIIKRQPCSLCREENGQGHHPDYSKPLKVVWLCQKHHSEVHRELGDYNKTSP